MNTTPSPSNPMPGDKPQPPQVRASAEERTAVVRILSDALAEGRLTVEEFDERSGQAYNARTRAELEVLTADLPVPIRDDKALGNSAGAPHTDPMVLGSGAPAQSSPTTFSLALFGGSTLDLRHSHFTAPVTTIRCLALFGGIDVVVPPGLRVEVSGVGLFGGFGDATENSNAPAGDPQGPLVRVVGIAAFGGVDVKTMA